MKPSERIEQIARERYPQEHWVNDCRYECDRYDPRAIVAFLDEVTEAANEQVAHIERQLRKTEENIERGARRTTHRFKLESEADPEERPQAVLEVPRGMVAVDNAGTMELWFTPEVMPAGDPAGVEWHRSAGVERWRFKT